VSGDKIQPFEQADALLCGYIHFYNHQRIQPKSKQTPSGKYGRMRKRYLQEHLTFSYGIVDFTSAGTVDEAVAIADSLMYENKKARRTH